MQNYKMFVGIALLVSATTVFAQEGPVDAVETTAIIAEEGVPGGAVVSTLEVDGSQPPGYDPEADLYNVEANKKAMESLIKAGAFDFISLHAACHRGQFIRAYGQHFINLIGRCSGIDRKTAAVGMK